MSSKRRPLERGHDYRYIRAWGKMLGSYPYYINEQVELARADNAPEDAVYKRDGEWQRLSLVSSEETKARILSILFEDGK